MAVWLNSDQRDNSLQAALALSTIVTREQNSSALDTAAEAPIQCMYVKLEADPVIRAAIGK